MALVGTARAPSDVRPSLTRLALTPIAGTLIRTGVSRDVPLFGLTLGAEVALRGVVAGPGVADADIAVAVAVAAFAPAGDGAAEVVALAPAAEGAGVTVGCEHPAMEIAAAATDATPRVASRRDVVPIRRSRCPWTVMVSLAWCRRPRLAARPGQ
jgi:hypothetical protein